MGAVLELQREAAVERHRARGVSAHWLEQIPDRLRSVSWLCATTETILHTEILRERVLVQAPLDGYVLSGLVDFERDVGG